MEATHSEHLSEAVLMCEAVCSPLLFRSSPAGPVAVHNVELGVGHVALAGAFEEQGEGGNSAGVIAEAGEGDCLLVDLG